VHPTETWLAMEKLLSLPDSPVRSIGLANFNSAQIQDILDKGSIIPAVNQVECHPYFNQNRLKAFLSEHGIIMVAFGPLGSSARPWAKKTDPKVVEDPTLSKIGIVYSKTAAQVALKWQVTNFWIHPIVVERDNHNRLPPYRLFM
jgi:aldehyde reductase